MDRLIALISALCALALAFILGIAVSYLRLPPYWWAVNAWDQVKEFMAEPDRLMPIVHDFEGVRTHKPDLLAPGSTLITSYFPEFDWKAGARLIDADGEILHAWHVDANALFGQHHKNPYIHGAHLFPNGDLLVSFEFIGMVRVSACGDVIWTHSDPRTHHSISATADGAFWTSGNEILRSADGRNEKLLNLFTFPVYEDLFLKISADGEVLKSVKSIEVMDKADLHKVVLQTGQRFGGDVFHLNDVEELSPEMADEYPLFEAGDIAVSLRDLHLLMVLNPDTLEVKWHSNSDTLSQHDVDFIGDGWIGAFDNNFDRTEDGRVMGGSRVVAIRPHTGERDVLFPKEGSPPFYTKWSGKWQMLENGNILLTEARAGRALEVTGAGEPVWEWVIEPFDAQHVAEVMEASRYPFTADDVSAWTCP